MGYCMSTTEVSFFIAKEDKPAALAAIKALASKTHLGGGASYVDGKVVSRAFSWVNTEEFVNAKTLTEAIEAWGWGINEDKKGNVIEVYFDRDKSGDEDYLFEAIGPYVKEGSFIQMSGEDGAVWRWYFTGKECINQSAVMDYENSAGILEITLHQLKKAGQLPILIGLHPLLDSKIEKLMREK